MAEQTLLRAGGVWHWLEGSWNLLEYSVQSLDGKRLFQQHELIWAGFKNSSCTGWRCILEAEPRQHAPELLCWVLLVGGGEQGHHSREVPIHPSAEVG